MTISRVSKAVKQFREDYFKIQQGRNSSDFAMAVLFTGLLRSLGPDKFQEFLTDKKKGLGLNGRGAIRANAMVGAYRSIPQKTVWLAAGWNSVSRMVRIKKTNKLRDCAASIMTVYKKVQRPLKDAEFDEIFDKHAPEVAAAREEGRKTRGRVYEERALLANALRYAVKHAPSLYPKLKKAHKDALIVAGVVDLTAKKVG